MIRNRVFTAVLFLSLILLPARSLNAQGVSVSGTSRDPRSLIREDITRCAGQLHSYEVPEVSYTKPPRGYKPFYISHFGRHGSRYHSSDRISPELQAFARMDSLGLLTDTGRIVYHLADTLFKLHDGYFGTLTEKGGMEHAGIARRMYKREGEVFRRHGRNHVLAVASTIPRCGQSMAYFCSELKGLSPGLEFDFVSRDGTDDSLTRVQHGVRNPAFPPEDFGLDHVDSVKRSRLPDLVCGARFFTDPEAAKACMDGGAWHLFMYNLMSHGVITQCLDFPVPGIYPYFTFDEWVDFCAARSAACMNAHGFTSENGEVLRRVGKFIIKDILDKADEALEEGSTKAADLRFSHDGGLLPLAMYLGLDGFGPTCPVGEEWNAGWYAFERIPMASNLQMVFYRGRKGDVIVKFLYNERETTLRTLAPFHGPYYRWTDLRPYLLSLCSVDC